MKIKRETISTMTELNSFLKKNIFWANGKNFKVDHLHGTCAESSRAYENIYGVYLTRPHYTWMGIWMAVTSRAKLRKRNLRYIKPDTNRGDYVGRLEIFLKDDDIKEYLCEEAFLYLFDPQKYQKTEVIDCSIFSSREKISYLKKTGFESVVIERKGKSYSTYIFPSANKAVVLVDEWQVALVNFNDIVPDVEIYLEKDVILELSKRMIKTNVEVGDAYIVQR